MTKEYIIVNGVPILRSLIAETAKELPYDNTKSQLQATNSQDAIDEINGKISEKISYIKGNKLPFFSIISKVYYNTYQVFIPYENADSISISVERVQIMAGNSDYDTNNYTTARYKSGLRITFTNNADVSGYMANVTLSI